MITSELWKPPCGSSMDTESGGDKTKGWKPTAETQARVGENGSLGSGSGRWSLDEGKPDVGGEGEGEGRGKGDARCTA